MSPSPAGSQSAAERRAAEAELRTLVARFSAAHQQLVLALRKALLKRVPTAHEIIYPYRDWLVISYSPSDRGYQGVLAIRADANGVKLYLNNGKGLPDPEKLLQGTAQARWMLVDSASTVARPAVGALIDEALARNRVPFASTGRGAIIIRSAAAA
jgi:hypothetical protein